MTDMEQMLKQRLDENYLAYRGQWLAMSAEDLIGEAPVIAATQEIYAELQKWSFDTGRSRLLLHYRNPLEIFRDAYTVQCEYQREAGEEDSLAGYVIREILDNPEIDEQYELDEAFECSRAVTNEHMDLLMRRADQEIAGFLNELDGLPQQELIERTAEIYGMKRLNSLLNGGSSDIPLEQFSYLCREDCPLHDLYRHVSPKDVTDPCNDLEAILEAYNEAKETRAILAQRETSGAGMRM